MQQAAKPIRLPNGNVFPFYASTSVEFIPNRGVLVKNGPHIAWIDQPDNTKATLIRDQLVSVVIDTRRADQPDWSILD